MRKATIGNIRPVMWRYLLSDVVYCGNVMKFYSFVAGIVINVAMKIAVSIPASFSCG